ncbi:MAG: PA2779 family protein [Gammaproteobacteria bacterium]|nr:PA2779 family protein [Gammaproteobacteria bacterium]
MRKLLTLFGVQLLLTAAVILPTADAGVVTTGEYLDASEVAEARADIQANLDREEVRDRLLEMGVEPEALEARVAALSDEEVMQMAAEMDEMPAGANMSQTTLILLIILIVILI